MRRLLISLLAVLPLVSGVASADETADLEAFVQDSRATVKAFAGKLQGALKGAIEEGGPVHAIPVCNAEAPGIARSLSVDGLTVGRTSHRLRNPDNAPDAWEAAVLDRFLARAVAGEDLKTMEEAALVESEGGKAYRYMKAIPVAEVCLKCHGAEIADDIRVELGSHYPNDRATGYALGELRGAFTISKTAE